MTSPALEACGRTLLPLAAQVALWLAAGLALTTLAARRGPRAAAQAATAVLLGVVLLTALALLPWPSWLPTRTAPVLPEPSPLPSAPESHPAPVRISLSDPILPAAPEPVTPPRLHDLARLPFLAAAVILPVLAAWSLLRLLLALLAVRRCLARSRPVADGPLLDTCDTLRRALGIRRPVPLRELPGLASPATVGVFRPVILLPEHRADWSPAETACVLAHELAHIQGGDYAGWLLARLAWALHAYQPLLAWMLSRLRTHQELAADALAAPHAGGPAAYARALCRLALRHDDRLRPGLARTLLPARLPLTRRVSMLLNRNRSPEGNLPPRRRTAAVLLLALACLALAGLRTPADAQPPLQVPVHETPTGRFLFGAGVNSAAGLTGSLVLNERNFDVATPAPIAPEQPACVLAELLILRLPTDQVRRLRETAPTDTANAAPAKSPDGPEAVAFVDNAKVRDFLKQAKERQTLDILSMPRVFTLANQTARVQVGSEFPVVKGVRLTVNGRIASTPEVEYNPTGIDVSLTPNVSADRQSIRLRTRLAFSEIVGGGPGTDQPLAIDRQVQEATFALSSGRTAMLIHPVQRPQPPVGKAGDTLVLVVTAWVVPPDQGPAPPRSDGIRDALTSAPTPTPLPAAPPASDSPPPPRDQEVLKALPPSFRKAPTDLTLYKRLVRRTVEPPRAYPLLGSARLERTQWQCTVYRPGHARPETVHIDKDRLLPAR